MLFMVCRESSCPRAAWSSSTLSRVVCGGGGPSPTCWCAGLSTPSNDGRETHGIGSGCTVFQLVVYCAVSTVCCCRHCRLYSFSCNHCDHRCWVDAVSVPRSKSPPVGLSNTMDGCKRKSSLGAASCVFIAVGLSGDTGISDGGLTLFATDCATDGGRACTLGAWWERLTDVCLE